MDAKIDSFWTSFGTILEPILEPILEHILEPILEPILELSEVQGSRGRPLSDVQGRWAGCHWLCYSNSSNSSIWRRLEVQGCRAIQSNC